MKKNTLLIVIILSFISDTIKADGQDFLVAVKEGVSAIFILVIWIGITQLLFFIAPSIREKEFSKKQKYLIWIFGFILACFWWISKFN